MLLLLLVSSTRPTSTITRPSMGLVQRPAAPGTATVTRPGAGTLVQRPDAATVEATPWTR